MDRQTSRPQAAFVLLLMQGTFWAIAGISALPFSLAGQPFLIGLGLASILLAAATIFLAVRLLKRRTRARRWVMGLEITCLAGSLFLLVLPIGANHGPVSLVTNVGLPLAVIVLLRGKTMRSAFAAAAPLSGL
jgi:4-amino-4-deoxy-L-arabinose transferase-like glycosyltransferase